jgi:[acyl-carrier-protein] S-malonyltransferase
MGRDLSSVVESVRSLFDEADRALGYSLSRLCFEGPEDELRLTANAQPAILTVSVAAARTLAGRGIHAGAVAGHSLGEYSALVTAGALSFQDAVVAVHKRGRYMQEAVPVGEGTMAAIMGIDMAAVEELCADATCGPSSLVEVANDNAPGQVVIAGHTSAVERAIEMAPGRGAKRAVQLPVSAPFHCSLMRPARERLEVDLKVTTFNDLEVPLVNNVEAREIRSGAEARYALIRQVTARVRWTESVRRLVEMGFTTAIEAGPGQVLAGLAKRIDRNLKVVPAGDPSGIEKAVLTIQGGSESRAGQTS